MALFACALAALIGTAYVGPMAHSALAGARSPASVRIAMGSGFGEKKIVGKTEKSKATRPGVYDKLKKTGVPEYSVFVREGESADWRAAGVLCVPRTASVGEAVSKAIYTREAELCGAVTKAYRDLDAFDPAALQFGYRAAEFQSDPIMLATRAQAADTQNFLQKFVSDLNNPVNNE
jgi:hypothetical protein